MECPHSNVVCSITRNKNIKIFTNFPLLRQRFLYNEWFQLYIKGVCECDNNCGNVYNITGNVNNWVLAPLDQSVCNYAYNNNYHNPLTRKVMAAGQCI